MAVFILLVMSYLIGHDHFVGEVDRSGFVGGGDVLLVLCVARDATLAVIGGVLKIDARIDALVIVIAPTIKNVFRVAVDVDEIANVGKLVKDPHRVSGLRL
jgi:hypothetical protein